MTEQPDSTNASRSTWFYKTSDGAVGPIDTKEFWLAIRNGVIGPRSLVRLADSPEWIAAAEIAGLEFPAPRPASNVEMRRIFAECLGAQQAKRADSARVRGGSPVSRWNVPFATASKFIVSAAMERFGSIAEWSLSLFSKAIRLPVVWVSIGVLLLAVLLPPAVSRICAFLLTERQVHTRLAEIFAESKELQLEDADPDDWDSFRKRSRQTLDLLIPKLKREAHVGDPASLSLLWVARDYLPTILKDKNRASTEIMDKIALHLKEADSAIKNASQSKPEASGDLLATLMIGFDVVAVCAVVGYFSRSWWSHAFVKR